jgi:hypothetical protein
LNADRFLVDGNPTPPLHPRPTIYELVYYLLRAFPAYIQPQELTHAPLPLPADPKI